MRSATVRGMTATGESTATRGDMASAVRSAATRDCPATFIAASRIPTAFESTSDVAMSVVPAIIASSVKSMAVVSATIESPPRAYADEHAIGEVAWAPISIRSARVRRVVVIPILTNRRRSVSRTNANSDSYLRLCKRQRQHQNAHQSQIFHVFHVRTPFSRILLAHGASLRF
jgi:hypothetical protein